MYEIVIDKNYLFYSNNQLGKGGFGEIQWGKNISENKEIAVKIEPVSTRSHLLSEYEILMDLQGGVGIGKVYKLIKKQTQNFLIMEWLGKSIEKLFSICHKRFSVKTIVEIAVQMLNRIEYIHSKGYIHRDLKPGNFLVGVEKNKNVIYLIDFGLSKRYIDKVTGNHVPYKEGKGITGTARYVSLFTHFGIEQSRRDDIEGMAYNLIYLAKGKLPWQGVRAKTKKEKHKRIMDKKTSMSPEEVCSDWPEQFPTLLKYGRSLQFEEAPNYNSLRAMFTSWWEKEGKKWDSTFDWDLIDIKKEERLIAKLKEEREREREMEFEEKRKNSNNNINVIKK